MLRNGSGGARQADVAVAVSDADEAAVGADGGAVEGTRAELTPTNPTPTPTNQPPTPTVPVGPDLSSAVGRAVSRPAVGSAVPASPEPSSAHQLRQAHKPDGPDQPDQTTRPASPEPSSAHQLRQGHESDGPDQSGQTTRPASPEPSSAHQLRQGHESDGPDRFGLSARPDSPKQLSLCRLSAEVLGGLGRDELLGVLGDIERLANRLAGYRAEVLGALDALSRSGEAPDVAPHLSLRDAAGVSERDARKMVRGAGKAREHPGVLEALSGGDINTAQAETLCDARVPDGVRADLVATAAGEDTDATRRRVRQAEADHCTQTPMERFERQRQARSAGWQRDHEGMLRLWAKLDPEVGAAVEAGLEALGRQYWLDDKQVRNGRRTPAQRDADVLAYALAGITLTDADTAAVDRLHARAQPDRYSADETSQNTARRKQSPSRRTTPSQREAKRSAADSNRPAGAAVDVADSTRDSHHCSGLGLDADNPSPPRPPRRESDLAGHDGCDPDEAGGQGATNSWDPARRLPPAQISVLIGLDALRGQTDAMGLTDAGVELPPHIVRRLACDAEIIPMILSGPGGPADAGRARRTVPLRLRRLLIARDRHCQWPGCNQPPSRCDAHHLHHWTDGGPTDLDNLVLLCHTHHHHLHQHGHKMIPQPDGTWTTTQATNTAPAIPAQTGSAQPRAP